MQRILAGNSFWLPILSLCTFADQLAEESEYDAWEGRVVGGHAEKIKSIIN